MAVITEKYLAEMERLERQVNQALADGCDAVVFFEVMLARGAQSLAVLVGREYAEVRLRLQLELIKELPSGPPAGRQ